MERNHSHTGDEEVPEAMIPFAQCPRLLPGEKKERFESLFDAVWEDLCPAGNLEWFALNQIVILLWEIDRYQNWKHIILALFQSAALEQALMESNKHYLLVGEGPAAAYGAKKEMGEWHADPAKRAVLETRIKEQGYDEEALNATAFQLALDHLAKIERFLSSARGQFNAMLKGIYARREFKNRARKLLDDKLKQDEKFKLAESSKPQQIAPN